MLVVTGVMTYYVAPLSFLYNNLNLFFFILNSILILMILGLAFIAMLIQPFLENIILKMFTHCLCRKCDHKLFKIVDKNLEGHGKRNLKTSLMFTIALSFLIFAGSSF